ncbi:hypothetical protein V5799_010264 [Amblyomma americanum]|uniref:GB1/RHD3-type G domain-containing protein n=1 Tax=Amblyomma americanum TaxID=6943 RepID=A0AAQ4F9K3_AMBAM
MTSSVQVYNVLRNIQEDQLQHLQFFAEYGKLAQKGAGNEPLQRLVFLVRDWEFPYEAPYGASGGRMILRDRLEIIGEEHEDILTLPVINSENCNAGGERRVILRQPGGCKPRVQREGAGVGALAAGTRKSFGQEGQRGEDNLPGTHELLQGKQLLRCRACATVYSTSQVYTKTFQGGSLPEPKSMLQATVEASNIAAKEKAMAVYMKGMEERPRGSLLELMRTHNELLTKACNLFRTTSKAGGEEVSYSYMESLRKARIFAVHTHY